MNKYLKFLKIRRSVRVFRIRKIPQKILEEIVDAARYAPTARNLQPWEFVIVLQPDKLHQLAQVAENGKFLVQAAACIAVFSQDTKYFLEDGSAATCNILLAATALGVASCWVAGDKKSYADQVNMLLNAPQGFKLVSLVALGYPQKRNVFKAAPKRPLNQMLHWDKF